MSLVILYSICASYLTLPLTPDAMYHWPKASNSKSESKTCNEGDSNPANILLTLLLAVIHEQLFYLAWCLVFQCTMRSLHVIKLDVGGQDHA